VTDHIEPPLIVQDPVPYQEALDAAVSGRRMVCGVCGGRVKFILLGGKEEPSLRSLFCVASRLHFDMGRIVDVRLTSPGELFDLEAEVRAMVVDRWGAPPPPEKPSRSCPCCRSVTMLKEENSLSVCPVCYWVDDWVQNHDPRSHAGANAVSLQQARANYASFGACEERFQRDVRPPTVDEVPPGSTKAATNDGQ
jgi:hypothetical protein